MQHTMRPALVLGTHTVGLGVIRALGSMGVPIVALRYRDRDHAHVSRYVTEHIDVPHPEYHEDAVIDLLLSLADRYRGAFLVPASDAALTAVSRHRAALAEHYVVGCTEWAVTRQLIDKRDTYEVARRAGVPVPQTLVPESLEQAAEHARTARYPLLVKPRESHRYFHVFRKKMVKARTPGQAIAAYREAAAAGLEVMLQEYIPGGSTHGANYNSYRVADGDPIEFTAKKVRNAPRETGSPCVVQSAHVAEVIEPGRRILQAMGFTGFSCIEFKRDARDGVYKLLEVNGRHNLSSLLAVRCGINFPWLHYAHLMDGTLPSAPPDYEEGIFWIDLLRDLSVMSGYLFRERISPAAYLRPYREPHVFAVIDPDDPKPFRARCRNAARAAVRLPSKT